MRNPLIVGVIQAVFQLMGLAIGLYLLHNAVFGLLLQALGAIIGILLGLLIMSFLTYQEAKDCFGFTSFRAWLTFMFLT